MLNVSDIEQSLDFYSRALGFALISDPSAVRSSRWATVRSGNAELMLSEFRHAAIAQKTGNPRRDRDCSVVFYFYPDDVVALYAHVIASGFEPSPLEVTGYGMREFSLADPDGHLLCCGQHADDRY